MEKSEFFTNKPQTKVNETIDKLIDQKDLETDHIFYNGRNEGEYSYSFVIKNTIPAFKLKMFVLKINENYTKIEYFIENKELLSQIEIINNKISEGIASEIRPYDSEARKITGDTVASKENNHRNSKLPKFLKITAIIILILGILTAIALSYTKTITTDYSYISGIIYDTSYEFDFAVFLSYTISFVIYSAIVYSIGEILEIVIENNKLLKQDKE